MLTPDSLADVMENRLPIEGYRNLFPSMNQAMLAADCTNINRAAAWMSQLGEESGGLRWFTELGPNCQDYEGRDDLGNTEEGDGCRFKGRGPIQITGRGHYETVSQWAFGKGYVPTPTYFVDNPDELATARYGFLGAVWYWTVARPNMNALADAGDIEGVTFAVNGGYNGLDVRERIWNHGLSMGDAILPDPSVDVPMTDVKVTPHPEWRGDPTFLPEALKLFGINPDEFDGWLQRGHGDFGAIWGIVWHHTGNVHETDEGIAFHPALGLAANILIHPDGRVVLTGVGIAWHAGEGIYPGIPEDGANQVTIGIECAYGPDANGGFTLPWPDVQVETMINVGAAITWFLGFPVDHNIAHKEWAGADNPLGINKQGKPDPANFDMNWFRGQIAARLAEGPTGDYDDMALINRASRSIYRQDNNDIGLGTEIEYQTNGMMHQLSVENAARMGDTNALLWINAVASGNPPVDDLPAWAQAHAQLVLDSMGVKPVIREPEEPVSK